MQSNATKVHNISLYDILRNADIDLLKDPPRIRLCYLDSAEIRCQHGDSVIVSAPAMPELDKRILPCLGVHSDTNGHEYVVLGGNEYSYDLIKEGVLELYTVV